MGLFDREPTGVKLQLLREQLRRDKLANDAIEAEISRRQVNTMMMRRLWLEQRRESAFWQRLEPGVTKARLKERFADLELWEDDLGWDKVGAKASSLDLDDATRRMMVERSRQYYLYNYPFMTRAVNLYTWYVFGRGVTATAQEEAQQEVIDAFLEDPANKPMFSMAGQHLMSNRWLTDGELFPTFFLGKGDDHRYVRMRNTDCLEITDILTDPDDDMKPLWYKREYTVSGETQSKTAYYADWTADVKDLGRVELDLSDAERKDPSKVRMGQWKYLCLGKRGVGLAFTSLEWLSEFKKFMERRIVIQTAATMIAWVTRAEGTHDQLDALRDSWGAETSDDIRRPPIAGTRIVENDKATTSWMSVDTQAAAATVDSNLFVRWISCGLGIFPYAFGWDLQRWATALAMEDPAIKSFQNYQERWRLNYQDTLAFVQDTAASQGAKLPEERFVDVDFPPIKVSEKKSDIESIQLGQQIAGATPDINKELIRQTLVTLGVNNVDELMDAVNKQEPETKGEEEQRDELVAALREHRIVLERELFAE